MSPRPVEPDRSAFEPAMVLAREGRHADAVRWVADARGAAPGDLRLADAARALSQVARLAEAAGDRGAALAALDLAVECRPGWADLHLHRALACAALDRRAAARAALDTALRIHPRFVAARLERALLDAREGLVGEAIAELRALGHATRISEPHTFEQGMECLERADWDAASARLRRALRLAEPELEQRLERYEALMDEDQPGRAAQLLREVLPRFEAYPDLHYRLGAAELREGAYDDALVSLARALELNPDFSAARVLLARALDALGARAQALEQVALVLQSEPGQTQALALEVEWGARAAHLTARADRRRDPT